MSSRSSWQATAPNSSRALAQVISRLMGGSIYTFGWTREPGGGDLFLGLRLLRGARALGRACRIDPRFVDRGEFRVGDISSCYADISRARTLLGYQPRYTLDEGMSEFADWARGETAIDRYEQSVEELRRHGLFGVAGQQ